MEKGLIRKGTYDIQFTFNKLGDNIFGFKKNYIKFDNEEIKANSQRYQVFATKGCICCKCGLKASYFALEKHKEQDRYHLNLYGINEQGKEVLFTKDHIIAKSKGGRNVLDNYQTMCIICNEIKGNDANTIIEADKEN